MTQVIYDQESEQVQFFPMRVKAMTDEETREYHRKKLFELSKLERAKLEFGVDGSIWKDGKPIVEEPDYEQKQRVIGKMKAPSKGLAKMVCRSVFQ